MPDKEDLFVAYGIYYNQKTLIYRVMLVVASLTIMFLNILSVIFLLRHIDTITIQEATIIMFTLSGAMIVANLLQDYTLRRRIWIFNHVKQYLEKGNHD